MITSLVENHHGDHIMQPPSIFLKDIRKPAYLESLAPKDRSYVDQFLKDMQSGPGAKAIDIEWQETCRGYYAHLEHLYSLDDPDEQSRYRELLREDIETWLRESPGNYMVEVVQSQVFGDV